MEFLNIIAFLLQFFAIIAILLQLLQFYCISAYLEMMSGGVSGIT